MFGFGGSEQQKPRGDVFDIDEIRQLVLDFPPPTASPNNDNGLIPLISGDGFTTKDALSKAYGSLIKNRYGKIPLSAVEKQFDVDQATLSNILRSRNDFMLSADRTFILTSCEQECILQKIYAKTRNKFVFANTIASEHEIDIQSVLKLVKLSETSTRGDSPLQFLDAPGQSRQKSLESGNSYVHTLATLLSLRHSIVEHAKASHHAGKCAEWSSSDLIGLSAPVFARLAQRFCDEYKGDAVLGYWEIGPDDVRYVTRSYLLRRAKRTLKQVAMGAEAFCDLEAFMKKYPTLVPDLEAAKAMCRAEVLHKDGNRYKWHFVTHYAIGDVGLNNTAKTCMELLGPQRFLNTKPYIQPFPKEIRQEIQVLLQNRIVEFWRYCGGAVKKVIGLEEWMVLKSIIDDMEFASKRIGRTCADDAFKRQVAGPSLSNEAERDLFLKKVQEEADLPSELLQRLWKDERIQIKSIGTTSFDERLSELRLEGQGQLETMWKSRVYMPMQIYKTALEDLGPSPLQDQLRELLHIHLAQDLIPSTLKRMRNKGLLRDPSSRKQVEKLESSLTSPKKDTAITKSIEKFHEKMGFDAVSPEAITEASTAQIKNMVAAMQEDTDAPRLFLSTVLVLLASKRKMGVVYATGKFAPRLLKVLRAELDERVYERLEGLKEGIKAGSVKEEGREEMRRIAGDALAGLSGDVAESAQLLEDAEPLLETP